MKEIRVNLEDEQYDTLKEVVSEKNVTISEFFRDLLAKQSGIEVKIDFSDIDSYVELIEKLSNQVSGVCATIYRTNQAYKQDVAEILRLVKEIDSQSNDIWRYIVDSRTNLYDETRKKLYTKVAENSYKRRRKKRFGEEKETKKYTKEGNEL